MVLYYQNETALFLLIVIVVYVSLLTIFSQYLHKVHEHVSNYIRYLNLMSVVFLRNCATLRLHTSPFFAAFHIYFLTTEFKYCEGIHLLSKRVSSILPVCYILKILALFFFNGFKIISKLIRKIL